MMGALFDDLAFVEDDDLVGLEDGVEAMCDGDGGASLHEFAGGFFEQRFGFRVKRGGGFVEDEDGASLRKARARARRWACPLERRAPLSPTMVSYFSGSELMNSCRRAALAALMISS
jgi:hypothetical protein